MKKVAEIKYPNSANLFLFCRRVLDHKFGGIRVIDQDVGQILGFDPADCSHWKKGKKNIRSIQAMKAIAEHLGVDEKLVVDVATGDLDETEAYFEYNGYGAFHLDGKVIEAAKKDFYRRHAGTWTKERENEFRDLYSVREEEIDQVVRTIQTTINFEEAPLYLPEVANAFPALQLVATAEEASGRRSEPAAGGRQGPVATSRQDGRLVLTYAAGTEMRPYMRFSLAKAMAGHFLKDLPPAGDQGGDFADHVNDVRGNLFAAKLLAPAHLVRREMGSVNVAKDVVSQLAEAFWVSKTFMNRRLRDILQNQLAL